MPSFAVATNTASVKARFATKMAMVKPTPPRMDAPSMCCQLTFSGKLANLSFTTRKLMSMMPSGLPTRRPKKMPKNTGEANSDPTSMPAKLTSALVRANSGRMPKYTHGYSLCSRRVAGGTTWRATCDKCRTVSI